jgi:uncharacterized LabA/DUF88 family protein
MNKINSFNNLSEIVFKKYTCLDEKFKEINEENNKNELICSFCTGSYFVKIQKGGKEYLECRCGNKISVDSVSFLKRSQVENYQKLLESIDDLKDDFLIKIRSENKNTENERVGIFVDVQNIYYGAKDSFNSKVDFKKLLTNVLKKRKLVIANAYVIEGNTNNKSFVSFLKQLGYELKSKELKTRGDGSQKGNSDIELAIDVLNVQDKVDTICLISGDGDFVPLVEYLKSKNIKVEVYSFSVYKNSTAFDLKQVASKFFEIDESYLLKEEENI